MDDNPHAFHVRPGMRRGLATGLPLPLQTGTRQAHAKYFDDRKDRDTGSREWMPPLLAGARLVLARPGGHRGVRSP